jgi:hypothetical protein
LLTQLVWQILSSSLFISAAELARARVGSRLEHRV